MAMDDAPVKVNLFPYPNLYICLFPLRLLSSHLSLLDLLTKSHAQMSIGEVFIDQTQDDAMEMLNGRHPHSVLLLDIVIFRVGCMLRNEIVPRE